MNPITHFSPRLPGRITHASCRQGMEFWMHPALCRPVIPACSEQSCQAEPCSSRLTSLYPTSKCLLEKPSISAFSGHPSSLRVTTASCPWFGNPTRRTGRLCSCRESHTGWAEQRKGAAFQGGECSTSWLMTAVLSLEKMFVCLGCFRLRQFLFLSGRRDQQGCAASTPPSNNKKKSCIVCFQISFC